MEIRYLGHSSFLLKGKTVSVVCDPYASESVGLKFPKHIAADAVTVSHDHPDHNAIEAVEGNPFIIRGPGEFEIKGVSFIGMSTFHDNEKGIKRGKNIVYRIEIDGLSIVHLGDLGHPLSTAEIENLDGVDILLIPVGGFYTIDAATAENVINEIEPSIVIPMHYKRPELVQSTFGEMTDLVHFLKEAGKEEIVPQAKLSITKEKLPAEMQIVVLE
jgi:L-ascorbate metabolism protein UlaG (beta-lactamase superfamily)